MLGKLTLYNGNVYRIGDKTQDSTDGLYSGRIVEELKIDSQMNESGSYPLNINVTIRNDDNFIPNTADLWAATLELTSSTGIKWTGKVNFFNFDADGNLYITASEKTAPELELQIPDEVRQVYTVDENFHQSSTTMTIPLVVGGTSSSPILLPTILIDKTEGVYLICVGEIRSIVKVYNGTEELPNTAYTAYTGTSSQAEHAGFAYVKINEDYRLNADGSYAEINVEVVGLKLGNHTEAECRNPARFLYYLLTTAATGVNGWGCGIDSNDIDTASFNTAITLCDTLNYKLDGIMWLRQSAQSWIDQICQTMHASYSIGNNGKRTLFIDYAGAASKKTFTDNDCQVSRYGKNSYNSVVYNKGVLSYGYNPVTGLFMQSAQYENAESIAQIGEQKFVGESYLINDAATALAVLEYTCKRSLSAAEAIDFETDRVDTILKAGDLITLNFESRNINGVFQIANISSSEYKSSISAVKFDTSVFVVGGSQSNVNWGNEKQITPALTPAQATNLLLSTGFDINPDGTGIPYISGTFTVPEGGWLAAAVQYGIGTNPTNWTELALITEGKFKLSPVNVGTVYSVRVRMITATGHSDYISGQITATGDTIPPAEPTIAVHATDKTVTVQCGLDNPPYDMGGFQIYRKKSTEADSAYTLIAMVAANRGYASFTDYVSEYVTYNYKAKSYDRSGNLSTNFSNVASVTVTGIQANDVAATALAMPTGSILRLSAKNCHGAEDTGNEYPNHISDVNGVKDVSGNGNHGRAYGNVAVLDGGEGFQLLDRATTTKINLNSLATSLNGLNAISICIVFEGLSTDGDGYLLQILRNNSVAAQVFGLGDKARIGGRTISTDAFAGLTSVSTFLDNSKHSVCAVFDFQNGKQSIYIDGVFDSTADLASSGSFGSVDSVLVGGGSNTNGKAGKYYDLRIYPRALSASEIKTIFMFPDDVTFGQMTADLIGANVIKASNLVMTENVISNAAQINNAVFQSLIVTNGSTVANQVSVGGRNLVKNSKVNKTNVTTYEVARFYLGDDRPTENAQVTIQIKGTLQSGLTYFDVYNTTSQTVRARLTENDKENGVYKKTFSWKIGGTSNSAIIIYQYPSGSITTGSSIEWVKLEYGNKATTWTPAPEDTDASINAITTNIYSPNTTTINGGNITTGTIQAAAIAANAITTEKLAVTAISRPIGCKWELSLKGVPSKTFAQDDILPDGTGFSTKILVKGTTVQVATDTTYNQVLKFGTSGYLRVNGSWFNAQMTFDCIYGASTPTDELKAIVDGRNSNYCGFGVYHLDTGKIQVCGNVATVVESPAAFPSSGYHRLTVVWNNSATYKTKIYLDGVLWIQSTTQTASNAGGALSYCLLGSNSARSGNINSNAWIKSAAFWKRALSDSEVKTLFMMGIDNESGQITADRIAAGCIETRHLTANAIVGKVFQTASNTGTSNAAGVRFNSSGIQGFNGSAKTFDLSTNGKLTCSDVDLSGKITATSGEIGNLSIVNGYLYNENTNITTGLGVTLKGIKKVTSSISYYCNTKLWQGGLYSETRTGSYSGSYKAYVIIDSTTNGTGIASTLSLSNGATAYCANGWSTSCDEAVKRDIKDVSTLAKLKEIRVKKFKYSQKAIQEKEWLGKQALIEKENTKKGIKTEEEPMPEFKDDENAPDYIMAMAGEFNKAFGVDNGNEESINYTNAIGVCMRAIQELAEISDAQRIEIDSQKAEIAELKAKLKIQQDEKSDVEQEASYTEKSDNSKDTDNLDFPDVGKNGENQQEEQKK